MFKTAKIGDIYISKTTRRLYDVIDKTANSICIFKRKLTNLGIDGSQWYLDDEFDKEFTKKFEDSTEKRFEKLKEWLHMCIKINNYYILTFDRFYYGMTLKQAQTKKEDK